MNPTSDERARPPSAPVRVVLRPFGTPLPMGFMALAAASTVFAVLQLGLLADDQGRIAALAVLALTVPLQATAAVLGFLTRDPVAGTGMAVQAGTWAAIAAVTLATPAGAHSPGLGVVLLLSAAAQGISSAAGVGKLTAALVMALSSLRFAVTGIAELTGAESWLVAAGCLGLVLGAVALFAALAFELEAQGYRWLPTGRHGGGGPDRADGEGEHSRATEWLEREPGVRRRL